ncbi:hypothetical protein MKEN_00964700 [Mycena kentingensis (nom. inval.)]|nr:hypothetical protein MKEN_00964700 [Mycena kentingensis (nom. inval.)]
MASRVFKRSVDDDPLAAALEPPEDETPEQRHFRLVNERAAKQTSDAIDEQLAKERQAAKKQGKPVKILLLGQSESGKSTTLKNFQLMCEPKAFRAERASWRAIIHLNVIRSVRIMLDTLGQAASPTSATGFLDDPAATPRSSIASSDGRSSFGSVSRLDADLVSLRARLLPLLQLEEVLTERIANPEHDPSTAPPSTPSRIPSFSFSLRRAGKEKEKGKEVAVNSSVAWKRGFTREHGDSDRVSVDTQNLVDWDAADEPGALLHANSEDLERLWGHPGVKDILMRRGVRLQEESGFFLDELKVITAPRYMPTDEHILRARLKTLGVSEHRIRLADHSGGISREFRIFDVGGQRSVATPPSLPDVRSIARWVPYFDDMDAIIFLAPISAFDQSLAEDRRVNRLADSLDLWTAITANKILQDTNIILFLNKIDIMQAKLDVGIRLADYYPAYGRRPNDFDSASKFLKKQFGGIIKQQSPVPRLFYCHLTHVTDPHSTNFILAGVKDMLMRSHLKDSHLVI